MLGYRNFYIFFYIISFTWSTHFCSLGLTFLITLYTLQIDPVLVKAVVDVVTSCGHSSLMCLALVPHYHYFFSFLLSVLTMDGAGGVGDWRPGEDCLR